MTMFPTHETADSEALEIKFYIKKHEFLTHVFLYIFHFIIVMF